jgi:hypothetical protein
MTAKLTPDLHEDTPSAHFEGMGFINAIIGKTYLPRN